MHAPIFSLWFPAPEMRRKLELASYFRQLADLGLSTFSPYSFASLFFSRFALLAYKSENC